MGAERHGARGLATSSRSSSYHLGAHRSNVRQCQHLPCFTWGLSLSSALTLLPICRAGSAEKVISQEPHSTSNSQGLVDMCPNSLPSMGGVTGVFAPGFLSFLYGIKLHLSKLGHADAIGSPSSASWCPSPTSPLLFFFNHQGVECLPKFDSL